MSRTVRSTVLKWLLMPFVVDTTNMPLVRAQLAAFSKQVPLLYFVLCANVLLCAVDFIDRAPRMLTVYLPMGLLVFASVRTIIWLRTRRAMLSDHDACRRLKSIVFLGFTLGVVCLLWSVALWRYADARTGTHITFTVAVTLLVCIACLMHLRTAALGLTSVCTIPYAIFLFSTGEAALVVLATNLLIVVSAMVYVLLVVARDFEKLINISIETERLSAENARLANTDSLTSLPNRRHFFDRLDAILNEAGRAQRPFAVAVLDIDGFKAVNDVYGHVTGDRLLIEVGQRLEHLSVAGSLVARLGGDEFAVIIDDTRSADQLIALGERICAALSRPFSLPDAFINVSASVGFAVFPVAGTSAEHLYERADYALYYAKHRKRGQPVIFSDEHETEIRNKGLMEQCLRTADLEAELSLHFQPLFDVVRDEPIAFEALARWHSPELGQVPPNTFIAIAERTDLIHRLTHTLLRKALAAARGWPEQIQISFNLSARDIASTDSMANIERIVVESGVEPSRIDFEVTESALVGDFEQAMASINRLRALGTRISLDDFGTGYSSLSYVHRLPLDKIKIDRSFIADIETRDTSRDILRTVLDLCRNLNISCVVEGMETAQQAAILRELGCRSMQGYYFARPMAQHDVLGFLAERAAAKTVPEAACES